MYTFAGIGSRSTPATVLELMKAFASRVAKAGWTLRSGGANGADSAFEEGCRSQWGKCEIYIPWNGFNNRYGNANPGSVDYKNNYIVGVDNIAMEMAKDLLGLEHWGRLTRGGRALHARNCYQVLGKTLDKPADYVIAYTEGGLLIGGTATALRLATKHGIKIYNLGKESDYKAIETFVSGTTGSQLP